MILCANPAAQFDAHRGEIESAVARVLASNRYILGPEVEAFEKEFADYIGCTDAIGVANGTDAIELALRALEIGRGDEVITVSHTAVASVAGIEAAGATPVLVDIDDYFTLDPARLDEVRTSRTRAVLAVHLYGQAADLDRIGEFCKQHGLFLIEDVAQAHGAAWKGRRLGSIGDIACFSCYPTKNLGAIGDGGVVTTPSPDLARKLRMVREYGWERRYISDIVGRNSRLDEIQAAVLRVKLRHLDADNDKRRALAATYSSIFAGSPVQPPATRSSSDHVYHLYVIRLVDRDAVAAALAEDGIQAGIHYPLPIHLQPAYAGRIRTGSSMAVTETAATQVLSLPMYPELSESDARQVAEGVLAAIQAGAV